MLPVPSHNHVPSITPAVGGGQGKLHLLFEQLPAPLGSFDHDNIIH